MGGGRKLYGAVRFDKDRNTRLREGDKKYYSWNFRDFYFVQFAIIGIGVFWRGELKKRGENCNWVGGIFSSCKMPKYTCTKLHMMGLCLHFDVSLDRSVSFLCGFYGWIVYLESRRTNVFNLTKLWYHRGHFPYQ